MEFHSFGGVKYVAAGIVDGCYREDEVEVRDERRQSVHAYDDARYITARAMVPLRLRQRRI